LISIEMIFNLLSKVYLHGYSGILIIHHHMPHNLPNTWQLDQ
jgi:hypothetical protein